MRVSTFLSCFMLFVSCVPAKRADVLHVNRFSNSWAVEIQGGWSEANRIAEQYGFVNHGQIGNLEGYYHFQLLDATLKESGIHVRKRALYSWQDEIGEQPLVTKALENNHKVGYVKQQKITRKAKRDYSPPTDPRFKYQWSLVNTGQTCGPAGVDLNVEPAWLQGLDGTGVVVALVDDGVEINHPDLAPNYDARASFDFVHNDSDPTPDPDANSDEPNSHGTQCAGEIGMAKNNDHCGVGVAYKSKIGGVKFNGEDTTDMIESQLLSYRTEYIQIYSSSWGPLDNGFTVEGPEKLLRDVFKNSVKQGRNGKGSIYVWASGNGGDSDDSCAADGYSSSIYTISVGSADQNSQEPFYDEQCASKMAVTYSFNSDTFPSSSKAYNQITTTTLHGKCSDDFTGTSASAPLLSGVIALCLQANPNLTWRDVQYLIAYTSDPDSLANGEFETNGAGLKVSHKFGFGAIDAEAMVTRARRWITVPPQNSSTVYPSQSSGKAYPHQPLTVTFTVTEENASISYLEHIEVVLSLTVENAKTVYSLDDYNYYEFTAESEEDIKKWLRDSHPRRGDIHVKITSPQKTTSVLLPYRDLDFINNEGYDNWPFMSVHHWGENPIGTWTLTVTFRSSSANVDMQDLRMVLYGTTETPDAVRNIPKVCDPACGRGCSGVGPENCDVCTQYRIPSTLMCVDSCPNGTFEYRSHYCLDVHIDEVNTVSGACTKGIGLSLTNIILISVSAGVAGIVCLCCTIGVSICCCVYCYRRRKRYRSSTYSRLAFAGEDDPSPTPV